MARYIKRHRKQFAGVAVPVFFLFLIGAMSLSVFPGWLKPSYGVPGAPCTPSTGTLSFFSPDCDICNGEICTTSTLLNDFAGQGGTTTFQCGVIFDTATQTIDFNPSASSPQCPNGVIAAAFHPFLGGGSFSSLNEPVGYPGCWTQCQAQNLSFTIGDTTTTFIAFDGPVPVCQPDTTFCQDISGGDQSSDCRTGICTAISTPDPTDNPSGCDYEYVDVTQNDDCQLCTDAVEAGIPACGNGVCERDENEDCGSCPIDCLIPGFEDSCPLTSGQTVVDACNPLPSPTPLALSIAFDGPPYNGEGSLGCEDGDLCTDNTCGPNNDTCESTEKAASGNVSDFCCPSGADTATDVDCYVPQECVIPPPIGNPELSGNCISSLVPNAGSTTTGAWILLMLAALAVPVALKRRQNY